MNQLNRLYDSIHMPAAVEEQIFHAAAAPRKQFRPAPLLAALLAAVLMVGCSPQVQALVKTSFPELGLTIYQQEPEKEGEARGDIVHVNTELPTYARIEDGKLIFTGNGENLDITDQIREDAPFCYTYEDEQGYQITLVVGYHGTIENFGTYTWIEKDGKLLTDAGRNIFRNTEEYLVYPWVEVMWDTLEIPWPLPGKDLEVDIVISEG